MNAQNAKIFGNLPELITVNNAKNVFLKYFIIYYHFRWTIIVFG